MNSSHFSNDIIEFLLLLDRYNVQYMIVSGEAVIYYEHVRLTGDIDFFYNEFWDNDLPGIQTRSELSEKGTIIQFGVPPNRIDLINEITGVSFGEAWEKRVSERIQ